MNAKTYTDVIIAGKVYTLGGHEEEDYLQRVAAYLNGKYEECRQIEGFRKQSSDYQAVLMELNIADDYFRARGRAEALERRNLEMEKEIYELKHSLITAQMKREVLEEKLSLVEEELLSGKKTTRSRAGKDAEKE